MATAVVDSGSVTGNTNTLTISNISIASGELLTIEVALSDGVTVSSVDYGSSSDVATNVINVDNPGAGFAQILSAEGLSGTNQDVVVNVSAMAQNKASCRVYSGADTPDNGVSFAGDNQSASQVLSPGGEDANNHLMDVIFVTGTSLTVGANQTTVLLSSAGGQSGGSSHQQNASDANMGWSVGGSSPDVAHVACRVPEAAAPSGRIMSSLAGAGGLAGFGGIAGQGGGLAG
ncbi:MAG: hypothetical protein O7D95_06175 [Betaproteobacteria bacterium]|nr:hypothetical protein [Betaproteobacteria bacterium]